MRTIWESLHPHMPIAEFVSQTVLRLLLSMVLGGLIGLERELSRKPAGIRTNMFICFGATLYTLLSFHYSGPTPDQHIAAQIIPGIGFIGAGAILRDKGSVTGLTTAATLFVVASIGMAIGGGQYLVAIFAAMMIFIALHFLGLAEKRFNIKPMWMNYEVTGEDSEKMMAAVNEVLEEKHLILQTIQVNSGNGHQRMQFTVDAKYRDHMEVAGRLRKSGVLQKVELLQGAEHE